MIFDELDCSIGELFGDVDVSVVATVGFVFEAVGGADVEALGVLAEVPFADAGGGVSGGLEDLGDADEGGVEIVGDGEEGFGFFVELLIFARLGGDEEAHVSGITLGLSARGVDLVARGVGAGHEAGAGGGAVGAAGMGGGESHAGGGEFVEVRSFVEVGAGEAGVLPAEVVGEDEDDVAT